MASRMYEIAFALGASLQSSFNSTFNAAQTQLNNVSSNTENLGRHSAAASKGFLKSGIGIAAAAGASAIAVSGLAVNLGDDLQKALNGVQSATGYSKESMSSMKDVMVGIYNNNFGENFEDIGKAIEEVGKQTNTTGKELQGMTENALLLRDTFGFEVTESTRSAKMMMDQFGLSGKESYNLIAQGAQWGLDKNGDLLDTINEYSVHFKQAGFSAEEMFNMLQNGTAGGTFSVDKLGDAVKEFGIRTKDGSKGTMEAFQSLGLDADKLSSDFAKGGATGKQAFGEVNKKLLEMKDPLAQNQIATALYGTMWEDLGVKGITALTDTRGEISNNTDALKKINEVKYDTFGQALQGIKRNLETGILLPISDKLLPILSHCSNWAIANMPAIKETVAGTMNVIGTSIGTVVNSIKIVINFCIKFKDILIPLSAGILAGALAFGIYTIAIKAWKIAVAIAETATWGFSAAIAFLTSPIGLVVLAIGLLVAAGVLLYKNWDTVAAFLSKTFNGIKDTAVSVFNSILDFFVQWGPLMLAVLTGPIGLLVYMVVSNFDAIKNGIMNSFSAIGSFVGGIIDGISNGFRGMVNSCISALNFMIGALNNLKIPEFEVFGKKIGGIGFNIPQIPMLANGGYIKHRQGGILANIGEGREDEIVSPVSKLKNFISGGGQQPGITYAPQIIIEGNASKDDIMGALDVGQSKFNRMMDNYFNGKKRTAFEQ